MSCVGKDNEMRSDKHATEPARTDCILIRAIIASVIYTEIMEKERSAATVAKEEGGRAGREKTDEVEACPADWRGRVVWDEMEVVRQGELRRWRRGEGRPGPSSCRSPFRRLTEILTPSIFLPCPRSNCHWPAH